MIGTGEQCDGFFLGGQSCISQGYNGGTLNCDSSCQYDYSECICVVPPVGPTPDEVLALAFGEDLLRMRELIISSLWRSPEHWEQIGDVHPEGWNE